jgi:hypothetical protein
MASSEAKAKTGKFRYEQQIRPYKFYYQLEVHYPSVHGLSHACATTCKPGTSSTARHVDRKLNKLVNRARHGGYNVDVPTARWIGERGQNQRKIYRGFWQKKKRRLIFMILFDEFAADQKFLYLHFNLQVAV